MITAVQTIGQRNAFLQALLKLPGPTACCMGAHLEAFWQSPASGWSFFVGDDAAPEFALAVRGTAAQLTGNPDLQELALFLPFMGVSRLQSDAPLHGWQVEKKMHRFHLKAGGQLKQPPAPEGLQLVRQPGMVQLTDFLDRNGRLSAQGQNAWDNFYADGCAKRNRGLSCIWTAEDETGILATAGAYAVWNGWAYLAGVETAEQCRRRGIGRWLTAALANELAAQGKNVTLLCQPGKENFYTALGFAKGRITRQYQPPVV